MIRVAALRVAPVKALSAVYRASVSLEAQGVAEDRRLFLVDADGAVVTLRRHPELTRVVPDLDLAGQTLTVALPDGVGATSTLTSTGEELRSRLFGKDRSGRLVAGPVADALSDYAGEPVRLVLADRTGVGWDEGPVSLLGRASAGAVGTPADDPVPVTARFRMLVELEGSGPFEEDSWIGRHLRLGQALVRVTHPLQRCVVINHSASTGRKDWDGLRMLAASRGRDRLSLGVIAAVVEPGAVRIGDEVTRCLGESK